ncbi:MAG: hypothetical protein Q8S17_01125 [Humidesulfovibrio sp.]|nr:hypothetical protein [Humidesulfovibrio sp.]
MRRILTGLLACVLILGLLAAGQAEAKVYKMKPEERAAALKEKKARNARKKAGKANAAAPGGWVEVKPGSKPERKVRKSAKVDEAAKVSGQKGQKSQKGRQAAEAEAKPEKKPDQKPEKKSEKKAAKKSEKKIEAKTEAKPARKTGKRERKAVAAKGDQLVTKSYAGETKVRGTGIEVRRAGAKTRQAAPTEAPVASAPATPPADDLSGYSVKRPGQDKPTTSGAGSPAASAAGMAAGSPVGPAVAPEVRQTVQPGPVDSAKPVGTEQKAGEGRF